MNALDGYCKLSGWGRVGREMLGWEETHRVEGGSGVRRRLSNKDMLRDTTREDRRQSIGFIRWLLPNLDL